MTSAESPSPDRPFPGGHSVVPARHPLSFTSEEPCAGGRNSLPLEAVPISTAHGLSIRLPIRAERVTVSKDVIVRERVVGRRREIAGVAHMEAEVRREELRTSTEGEIEVVDTQDESTRRQRGSSDVSGE